MWWPFGTNEPNALTRQDRKKCWDSRDGYFECLNNAGVVKPGDEQKTSCTSEAQVYEKNCAKSWIEYFNQRRVIEEAQKQRLAQARTQSQSAQQ